MVVNIIEYPEVTLVIFDNGSKAALTPQTIDWF